jgi:uncharacterized protein YfkK (UPF0435 family)
MRVEIIKDRLQLLHLCLQYSSQKQERLTILDRMLINQERGQLLKELDAPNTIPRPVPETVETKLTEIQNRIELLNWKPLTQKEVNKQNGEY